MVNPLGGEPPTGEPDAGEPPVRFGGRGSESNRLSLPLSKRGLLQLIEISVGQVEAEAAETFYGVERIIEAKISRPLLPLARLRPG